MATLNLEPAISTRYRIERLMYRGRCGLWYRNGLAHCSLFRKPGGASIVSQLYNSDSSYATSAPPSGLACS